MEVVFDTCTLLNLICIDEEDNYLYKKVVARDFLIASTVCDEIKRKYKSRVPQFASKNSVEKIIGNIHSHVKNDKDILRDIGSYYTDLIKYTSHIKKENGELLSAALCLLESRFHNTQVVFYTDDKPAIDEFKSYFRFQQIGHIADSVDLLIYLHWNTDSFPLSKLKEYLSRLRKEYAVKIFHTKKEVENICNSSKKTILHSSSLLSALENCNVEEINKYLNLIDNKSIKDLFKNNSVDICHQVRKVNEVLNTLKEYNIFNLIN